MDCTFKVKGGYSEQQPGLEFGTRWMSGLFPEFHGPENAVIFNYSIATERAL